MTEADIADYADKLLKAIDTALDNGFLRKEPIDDVYIDGSLDFLKVAKIMLADNAPVPLATLKNWEAC